MWDMNYYAVEITEFKKFLTKSLHKFKFICIIISIFPLRDFYKNTEKIFNDILVK